VIDEDGAQLGIMPPSQALMIAEEKGLDLVEIAASATPPVCKIMNSGKYFYQQAKRESEARKHQRHIQVKEVKFRVKIDEHDFQFKTRNVERFLLEGNKVKSAAARPCTARSDGASCTGWPVSSPRWPWWRARPSRKG